MAYSVVTGYLYGAKGTHILYSMELEESAIAAALLGLGSYVVRILETAKLVQLETDFGQ